MNRWNGYFGTGAVVLFAVFLSTVFLARNGHGNPMVAGTQISVSPRMADDAVGTRRAVSPRLIYVGTRRAVSPRLPYNTLRH